MRMQFSVSVARTPERCSRLQPQSFPAARHLWSKSALARVDLEIDEFDLLYRSAVIKTNNALVEYINEHGPNFDL